MGYFYTNASGTHRASSVNDCKQLFKHLFFYETTQPTVLKFHMELVLTPMSRNYEIETDRISKMAAVTKNSKDIKINFFSRTTGYIWLNFDMEHLWNISVQNY